MKNPHLYRRFKIAGHFLFWIASVGLLSFIFGLYDEKLTVALIEKAALTNVGFALAVYVNIYVLIPRFLKQKNYIFYLFWLIVLITASSLLIQILFVFTFRNLLNGGHGLNSFSTNLHSAYFFATLFYIGITSFLKFIKEWLSMQDLNLNLARIEQQKLEAELNTLKGQLNPHFLFNSLNNIYSLALIQSNKVPDLILKLSDLMRHIIYESKENYISLAKEIEFVDNFVALQKIRTSEKTRIDYSIEGEIPSGKIAPLLFEPFIDNAFKHGLPGFDGLDFISIRFRFDTSGTVQFEVENNFDESATWVKKNSGIGLENVKKRLQLLYLPSEYEFQLSKENRHFKVALKIKLK